MLKQNPRQTLESRGKRFQSELQTNVAITTQMGELDKLVALLQEQPKGRPASGPSREVRARTYTHA